MIRISFWFLSAVLLGGAHAVPAQEGGADALRWPGAVPDLREEKPPVTVRKGNFVVVPIPFSNPTLDSGLVLGVGYFHAQSEQQKAVQPPSVTGVGAMASGNGSKAVGIGNASYWDADRWRFTGVVAGADLDLPLLVAGESSDVIDIDWRISGVFSQAAISRRLGEAWYLGVSGRWINLDQEFDISIPSPEFTLRSSLTSAGIGLNLSYDTRDLPSNAYSGQYFKLSAMANSASSDPDGNYTAYNAKYARYHALSPRLTLAWELAGCRRTGDVPLWDACRIGLRGFASTDYMGRTSYRGQAEARWRFSERWGAVGFAGGGWIDDTLSGQRDRDLVPSVGVGLRFMVQKANRINMRLDYARSKDSDAVILSVMEAF